MMPYSFPQQNKVYAADGMGDLPLYEEDGCFISAWRPNKEDLEALNGGGFLYLKLFSHRGGHPPVELTTEDPWRVPSGMVISACDDDMFSRVRMTYYDDQELVAVRLRQPGLSHQVTFNDKQWVLHTDSPLVEDLVPLVWFPEEVRILCYAWQYDYYEALCEKVLGWPKEEVLILDRVQKT